ncbi:hypothetical protein Taro_001988 [Colocasia esculenta]|uniref:Uncharacterized protein n=1 Tax=Colocasia esculenta TaxID=4460 RepID=A0A843THF3_COLES|nr:hypothetical protein [Colocasia esculenta]
MGGDTNFGVCGFPGRFVCVLQEGFRCCHVSCMASVVTWCVCAVVARLAVHSLAVVFLVWRTLAGKSRRGALGSLRRIWVRVCFVCRVASLVEHYDTCLWLLVGLVLAGCEL